jgi:hypothetical protein
LFGVFLLIRYILILTFWLTFELTHGTWAPKDSRCAHVMSPTCLYSSSALYFAATLQDLTTILRHACTDPSEGTPSPLPSPFILSAWIGTVRQENTTRRPSQKDQNEEYQFSTSSDSFQPGRMKGILCALFLHFLSEEHESAAKK